jgi:hypothetical protein
MQIFLTEAFTFILETLPPSCDPGSAAVRFQLKLDSVAYQDSDAMQTHFSSKVRQGDLAGIELHPKKCIRKRLFDDPFHNLSWSHICAN